jgi:ArsR family transcriptional regulator
VLSSATELDLRPLSRLFRALGDETRLRIVALLAHGELCVCHVERALGLSQPNASRQLGILKAAGVVDGRRDGTWVSYRIAAQEHAAVQRVLALLTDSLSTRRALRSDLVRLRKRCGPDACR